MSLSMYESSAPVLTRMLGNISAILQKAEDYVQARSIEPSALINARLAPDMFPLSRQIQIATDMAKGCAARLAGLEVPSYEDNETTFADLQARIAKTRAFIESIAPQLFEGSETREVVIKVRGNELRFDGKTYLLTFVLPNFYFHLTTTYAILRHNGLQIGKMDFLGS